MTGVLMKRKDMRTETHTQKECYMNTKMKEEMTLQAKKCPRFPGNHQKPEDRPGPDSSLQPLENAFSDIQPPELGDAALLFFKKPSVWSFVMAALGNWHAKDGREMS